MDWYKRGFRGLLRSYPIWKSNCNFASLFFTLRFYPYYLKMNTPFTPILNCVRSICNKPIKTNRKPFHNMVKDTTTPYPFPFLPLLPFSVMARPDHAPVARRHSPGARPVQAPAAKRSGAEARLVKAPAARGKRHGGTTQRVAAKTLSTSHDSATAKDPHVTPRASREASRGGRQGAGCRPGVGRAAAPILRRHHGRRPHATIPAVPRASDGRESEGGMREDMDMPPPPEPRRPQSQPCLAMDVQPPLLPFLPAHRNGRHILTAVGGRRSRARKEEEEEEENKRATCLFFSSFDVLFTE